MIIYTGFDIIKIALPELLDKGAPQEIINKLREIVLSFAEVKEVHIIRLRPLLGLYTGDFHILINPDLSIFKGHTIAEKINTKLEETGLFTELLIHIEPYVPEEIVENSP